MELEKKNLRANCAEEYRVLLRAEAQLLLPKEYERICEFYSSLAAKCIDWMCEVTGEELRRRYLALSDRESRARFGVCSYRIRMHYPMMDERHAAIVFEAKTEGIEGKEALRRLAHVWYLPEQTALPQAQILKRFWRGGSLKEIDFRPDGIYPTEQGLVFFKNAIGTQGSIEKRLSFDSIGN